MKEQLMASTFPKRIIFFGPSWSPGEPSEERHIEHEENTFMSIKIDRVIRFCSTFF
jgi:hypothetical protein